MVQASPDDTEERARITLDLLLQAEPSPDNKYLQLASRIAFPLERLEDLQHTLRFRTSFAIETLLKAMTYREGAENIRSRYAHALACSMDWANSFRRDLAAPAQAQG